MMRSNARSEQSDPIIEYLVLSKLFMVQAFASGDHSARIYGCRVGQVGPKQSKLKIHPYCSYDITRYTRDSLMIRMRYSPRRKSEFSVNHMAIAIAKIIFALFQIAILPRFLECRASGKRSWETHTRSTINRVEEIKATEEKSLKK